MRAVLRGMGWTSATGLFLAVLVSLLESASGIYTGPGAPTVIAIASVIAGYLRTKKIAKSLMSEGEDIDAVSRR